MVVAEMAVDHEAASCLRPDFDRSDAKGFYRPTGPCREDRPSPPRQPCHLQGAGHDARHDAYVLVQPGPSLPTACRTTRRRFARGDQFVSRSAVKRALMHADVPWK